VTTRLDVLCVGGATVDRKYRLAGPARLGTSNPGHATLGFGGVARNVAVNLARLGRRAGLATRIGEDAAGGALRDDLVAAGVDVSAVTMDPAYATAEYVAILDPSGALVVGVADMAVLDHGLDGVVEGALARAGGAGIVFADCNMPRATFERFLSVARGLPVRIAVDAVSVKKAAHLPDDLSPVAVAFMNRDEAAQVLGEAAVAADVAARRLVEVRGAGAVIVTDGARGAFGHTRDGRAFHCAARSAMVVDVTGAGDAFIAGTLDGLAGGLAIEDAARRGAAAAAATVESPDSVRADIAAVIAAAGEG